MAHGGPRSALQAGLAAVLAGLVSLALVAETSASTQYDTIIKFQGKALTDSARFFFYNSPCKNVAWRYDTLTPINASIQWGNVANVNQLNLKCSSIAFHPVTDCKGDSYVTYQRPQPITSKSFTNWTLATGKDLPASMKCWTGCERCGTAMCALVDGKKECVCPTSQVFDATAMQCRAL